VITVNYTLDDAPGVRPTEDRGRLTFAIGRHLTPPQIVNGLNQRAAELLSRGHWFQEWRGDIVTAPPAVAPRMKTARIPPHQGQLRVEYRLDYLPEDDIDVTEDRGHVVFTIGQHLDPEQIVSALNAAAAAILAGGHWYQEWQGEVVASANRLARVPAQGRIRHDDPQPESDAA
jgi:hypothetical protein